MTFGKGRRQNGGVCAGCALKKVYSQMKARKEAYGIKIQDQIPFPLGTNNRNQRRTRQAKVKQSLQSHKAIGGHFNFIILLPSPTQIDTIVMDASIDKQTLEKCNNARKAMLYTHIIRPHDGQIE